MLEQSSYSLAVISEADDCRCASRTAFVWPFGRRNTLLSAAHGIDRRKFPDDSKARRIGVNYIESMPTGTMYITGNPQADALLNTDGTALLIGMLLDQQVPMEWAFAGPATLRDRLGHVDAATIAAMDVDEFVSVCCLKPAIHRFPAAMGRRVHELCVVLTNDYGGTGSNVWMKVGTGDELYARMRMLPGYGDEKAKIFIAILAKRMGVALDGWQHAAGKFGDDEPRSVADITDAVSLGRVREWKRAQKAANRDKQDRPLVTQ